ncbi:MAG: type I-D CRISPR-associated protein Cas7/Csc2 [Fimbriimonadia bacterium]|nr:type I-D CRISPR-associated protein Cas7/Csc2 [Fimbriimonadia bacterium]
MSKMELLRPYTVDKPEPIIGSKTIQLILMREVLDYTVLRTEETRELNTVVTPLSANKNDPIIRVAFLATKQKAAESRQLEQLLRTATQEHGMSVPQCYLKDNLCLQCPRCALFGATSVESGKGDLANIKHRLEYSTAFSLFTFEDIESAITFNAINDSNQTTGQALGTRYAVAPATVFPSIVTLRSVTLSELILTIKTLLASKSYGAESRIGGDMRNSIYGIIGGWEEVITPLELTLELFEQFEQKETITGDLIQSIAQKYLSLTGNPDKVSILSPQDVEAVVKESAETPLTKKFLEDAYEEVKQYRKLQEKPKKAKS